MYLFTHRWGIVHTEKFWRENARFLEDDEFKNLKALIALLSSSDPVSVNSACTYILTHWHTTNTQLYTTYSDQIMIMIIECTCGIVQTHTQ
jgi:hypothetical protein